MVEEGVLAEDEAATQKEALHAVAVPNAAPPACGSPQSDPWHELCNSFAILSDKPADDPHDRNEHAQLLAKVAAEEKELQTMRARLVALEGNVTSAPPR
jgi:hypothetical protein